VRLARNPRCARLPNSRRAHALDRSVRIPIHEGDRSINRVNGQGLRPGPCPPARRDVREERVLLHPVGGLPSIEPLSRTKTASRRYVTRGWAAARVRRRRLMIVLVQPLLLESPSRRIVGIALDVDPPATTDLEPRSGSMIDRSPDPGAHHYVQAAASPSHGPDLRGQPSVVRA